MIIFPPARSIGHRSPGMVPSFAVPGAVRPESTDAVRFSGSDRKPPPHALKAQELQPLGLPPVSQQLHFQRATAARFFCAAAHILPPSMAAIRFAQRSFSCHGLFRGLSCIPLDVHPHTFLPSAGSHPLAASCSACGHTSFSWRAAAQVSFRGSMQRHTSPACDRTRFRPSAACRPTYSRVRPHTSSADATPLNSLTGKTFRNVPLFA
jgi:hypothetical protein